jgi:small subunit ribosomal protein S18
MSPNGRHSRSGGSRKDSARRGGRPKKQFLFRRRKFCKFCEEKVEYIDYKDVRMLQGFVPERSKILPRRISGTCASHQRGLMKAIKRARNIALVPFTSD